ncbi:unnamed protein product, partial [Effrenium voratum]
MDTEVAQRAHELCRQWDTEGDGALHFSKLQAVLKEVCPEADEEELKTLISSVDINGDGVVQYEEFLRWLRFPPAASGVKMSFEDTLKSGMLDRIKLDQAGSKDDAMNPVAAEPDVRCAAKPSTDEEDDILMESFVHPLLDRFMVCKDTAPGPGVLPVKLAVSHHAGGLVKNLGTVLEVAPAECHQANSLPELLAALSQAYKAVFDAFLEDGKFTGLRLVPLTISSRLASRRAQLPQPLWSAVALALGQLNSKQQKVLKDLKVELAAGFDADAYRDTLASKVAAAEHLPLADSRGRIPKRDKGYSWCRRDNDADARLFRLETFLLTQRAAYMRTFKVSPTQEVSLNSIDKMLAGTQVFTGVPPAAPPAPVAPAADAVVNADAAVNAVVDGEDTNDVADPFRAGGPFDEQPLSFQLKRVEDMEDAPPGETVMEVAAFMAGKGVRCAAVNAASAYQAGGGASTGGRHALEEAWCISSTLFQSLALVEPLKRGGLPGYRQHIPATGCIVSPHVQIFRECTDDGYGFLDTATELPGVVSVA